MKKEEKGTAVAAAPQGSKAVGPVIDYGQDAGRGYEGQTQADVTIPFLAVLQTNSPQITAREDCKPGMLINTVTEEVVDGLKTGLILVPALTEHCYVEWKPRDKGGGFVAKHLPESPVVVKAKTESREFGKYKTPAGNDLAETFYIYAVLLEKDNTKDPGMPIVIGFTSTKIGVYKKWNTKIKMFTIQLPDGRKQCPPLFAHQVRVTTYKETGNPKGEFFNFVLAPAVNNNLKDSLIPPGDPRLEAAKELKRMVEGNLVKVAHDSAQKTEGEETTDGKKPVF
jgi:hypothetical protein